MVIQFIGNVDVDLVKVDQSIIVVVDLIYNNSVICESKLHVVERVKIVDTIHGLVVAKSHSTEHIPSSTLTDIIVVVDDVFGKDDSVLIVER
jgi:hypothetical protein